MPPIHIVLVGTQHPGNIGAAARAMKTMGLYDLVLVAPERFPHAQASALAAGADDVLAAARVVDTPTAAIADCGYVLGCTARARHVALPELSPRAAAAAIRARATATPVALLFGRENSGLSNAELMLCHAAVRIPANPDYSSLNLAAAVQILCYELRMAALAAAPTAVARVDFDDEVAEHADLEQWFAHLARTLEAIDFHKGRAPDRVMQRLRRLFMRASPSRRELRVLHGILADAERMAMLARKP